MSANTNISEGGKARPFGPVTALMVQGEDGKYYSWYPESDRALGTLSVDKNGVYRASDKGLYGWSSAYVNVTTTDSVTGRDPDTGEEVVVRPDPETGEITETVVPVEIRVITPPTKTEYQDGETIDISGMVVKAYGANGDEMQTVPIGEITINPTVAVFDPDSATEESEIASIADTTGLDDRTVAAMPFTFGNDITFTGIYNTGTQEAPGSGLGPMPHISPVYIFTNRNNGFDSAYACSRDSFSGILYTYNENGNYSYSFNSTYSTINGNPVYWATLLSGGHFDSCEPRLNNFDSEVAIEAAYVILYGTHTVHPAASAQTITVSWPRPGDGAILETTFEITVGPRSGQGDD